MALFKKLTTKVVQDVKNTVKEETQKTTEEIKEEMISTIKEYLPYIVLAGLGIAALIILKNPTPVVVKVIVKQV